MKIYLPIIISAMLVVEIAIAFWVLDPNNQRPFMEQHPALMAAAQWKAEYIDSTLDISHCTKFGECPNATVERFGCYTGYDPKKNYVESLVWGISDAGLAYKALIRSPSHRIHLLGLNDFFKKQTHYGVGYHNLTFVFLSAVCK